MKKLIRLTTADISLNLLLKGQLRFLNQYFEVVGVSSDTGLLKGVGEREGIRTIAVPMHREIALGADIVCLWKLYRLFRRERPDILHSNTPKGSLLAMIAGWLARVPVRIYLVTGLRYQGANGMLRWVLRTMERLTCRFATKVIPEGNGVKQALIADHITQKPLEILHYGNINGLDTSYFSPNVALRAQQRERLGFSDDDFVFIFIGRIVKDKGMNELAWAMRQLVSNHPHARLLLVGPFESELDPLEGDNEQFFREHSSVAYVGYQADVRPFLAAADALVFPSYREGFPNVVLQAGAMGLPSIVTDINGCNEVITDGVNGRIIQPRDREALLQMMSLFVEDAAHVSAMAEKARTVICERYDQQDVWQALLEMYVGLVES